MQGYLSISPIGGPPQELSLPKERCYLTTQSGTFQVSTTIPTTCNSIATFEWNARSASWTISELADSLEYLRNGAPIARGKALLSDSDTILIANVCAIYFQSQAEPPLWRGKATEVIELKKFTQLLFGRAVPNDSAENRVSLDADSLLISKQHAQLTLDGTNWVLEDLSKTGTELNGKLILNATSLVYGDRFAIADYLFEFAGSTIKRVDHLQNGNLQASQVTVTVKDRQTKRPLNILNDVSTSIKQGEFIGILGGSGQGKSTFLDAMCGIRPPTKGTITIGGIENTELTKKFPGTIGYVPQDDIVHKELTVIAAFNYSAKLRLKLTNKEQAALIERTLETLGLGEHSKKRIKTLSGGQRKRVSIGIELLSKPSVLFLDEPSSGLDPATEQSLMELLQSLSINNLTVVCTTHVLQNAYIFNRLFFIHSGKLIFTGNTDEFRNFFSGSHLTKSASQSKLTSHSGSVVSPLEKIYSTILNGSKTADQWAKEFQLHSPQSPLVNSEIKRQPSKKPQPLALSKLYTLLQRQWAIVTSDWLNLLFLLAQVIIIGLLTAWVSDDLGFRTFIGLIAAMWFGCSNGAQQIISELPILNRERVCGLGLNVYILSKLIFQGALSTAQCLILFAVITFAGNYFHPNTLEPEPFYEALIEREHPYIVDNSQETSAADFVPMGDPLAMDDSVPDESPELPQEEVAPPPIDKAEAITWIATNFYLKENILESGDIPISLDDGSPIMGNNNIQRIVKGIPIWEVISTTMGLRIGAFLLVTSVGVCMGLAVSSLVRSSTQAVMWVPLLLIPQILLGGFVIKLPEMKSVVRDVSTIFPSHAAQRMVDVSHLYGRTTPSLSNQTKHPIYLTSDGKKETVSWNSSGEEATQDYQKASDVNTSWQNLATRAHQVGHHKQAYDVAYGTDIHITADTVERRNDVRYQKGTPYRYLQPAQDALAVLLLWVIFCYLTIICALWKKQVA